MAGNGVLEARARVKGTLRTYPSGVPHRNLVRNVLVLVTRIG